MTMRVVVGASKRGWPSRFIEFAFGLILSWMIKIAVDDALLVGGFKRLGNLLGDGERFGQLE